MRPHERVAALLRARRWTLGVLAHDPAVTCPDLPGDVWDRFLELERCAAVVLSHGQNPDMLPTAAIHSLRSAAATESQSSLRARAEGTTIANIASRLDVPVVVLKGGARAIAGLPPTVPLNDIDLLVDRTRVDDLTMLLSEAGFGRPVTPTRHHQGLAAADDRLAVEVHWTTSDDGSPFDPEAWKRIRPIAGLTPLMQLSAADNLDHMLTHAVSSHPDRSVSIRDLVLAGISAEECSDEELEGIRQSIETRRHSGPLKRFLSLAIQLATPSGKYPDDPFEREAATFFAATVAERETRRRIASPSALAFVTAIAIGRTSPGEAPAHAWRFRGTGNPTLSRMSTRFPRIVNPVIGAAHAAYYGIATAALLPRIRRTVTRALRLLDAQSP